jgi:raffinose/stachyose/melibiose transport system substrate-binding protein
MKKIYKLTILTLLCLLLASGIVYSAAQAEDQNEQDITLTVKTRYLESEIALGNPVDTAFFDSLDRFRVKYPNVIIEYEGIPHDIYEQKVQTLAAANELPDVSQIKGSWNKNIVDNGLIIDLKPIMDADEKWATPITWKSTINFQIGNSIYALSDVGGSAGMAVFYYNKAIFDECGISEFPKTISGLYEAIELIKAKGYVPIALGNKGKWVAESCILSTLGARFTGEEWNESITNRTGAKFTDTPFIQALEELQKWATMGAFNSDVNSIDNNQHKMLYYNKKAAMFIEGYWAASSIVKDAPEDVLENTFISFMPEVGREEFYKLSAGGGGGWGFAISSKLEGVSKDAAIGLVKEIISVESAKSIAEGAYNPTVLPGEYDASGFHRLIADLNTLSTQYERSTIYDARFDPAVIEVMNSGLQELLINAVTPQALAERIQKEYVNAE